MRKLLCAIFVVCFCFVNHVGAVGSVQGMQANMSQSLRNGRLNEVKEILASTLAGALAGGVTAGSLWGVDVLINQGIAPSPIGTVCTGAVFGMLVQAALLQAKNPETKVIAPRAWGVTVLATMLFYIGYFVTFNSGTTVSSNEIKHILSWPTIPKFLALFLTFETVIRKKHSLLGKALGKLAGYLNAVVGK